MQPPHDVFCDGQHLPRQQCNDASAPAEMQVGPSGASAQVAHEATPIVEPAPGDEPVSSAIREAVAESDAMQPTVYVSREWDRTAAAVGARPAPAVDADERSGSGGLRRTALVLAAIALVLITARGVRGRPGERV